MNANVLVVDDDEEIRNLVKLFLEMAGCKVSEAATAAAARRAFTGPAPDAVLLDLNLPDAHGLDLVPEFKNKWPKSKIVILTGDHSLATAEAAYRADGQVFLLNKPFDAEMLVALLELALSGKAS